MAAWHPSVPTYSDSEKTYSASDFRGAFPAATAYSGDVKRHKMDCELMAAAAARACGPSLSDSKLAELRALTSSSDNVHYYGSHSANTKDRLAANAVLQAYHTGGTAVLTAHQAAHIRAGAEWVHAHRDELPAGMLSSFRDMYSHARDKHGHKVVDQRKYRF